MSGRLLRAVPASADQRPATFAELVRPEFCVDVYLPARDNAWLYGPHCSVQSCERPGNELIVDHARLCQRHAQRFRQAEQRIDEFLATAPVIAARSQLTGLPRYDLTSNSPVTRTELRLLMQTLHDGAHSVTFNSRRWNVLSRPRRRAGRPTGHSNHPSDRRTTALLVWARPHSQAPTPALTPPKISATRPCLTHSGLMHDPGELDGLPPELRRMCGTRSCHGRILLPDHTRPKRSSVHETGSTLLCAYGAVCVPLRRSKRTCMFLARSLDSPLGHVLTFRPAQAAACPYYRADVGTRYGKHTRKPPRPPARCREVVMGEPVPEHVCELALPYLRTRPWSKAALAMLATLAAVAVGYVVPSAAGANHVQSVLTVAKSPTEGGTVTGYGIDCGTDCAESFEHTVICEYDLGFENCYPDFGGSLLRATSAPGYAFDGWTDCPYEQYGECHASLQGEDLTVTARFRRAECSDGLDNDSDLQVDLADTSCASSSDDSEAVGPEPLDDLTPPPFTLTPASIGVTRDPTPTVEFSSTEAGVTYTCWVLAVRPDTSILYIKEAKDNCTSPYTTPALEDGDWRIEVHAINAAKRAVSEKKRPLTVDTTAPDTSITSGPSGTARSTSASFHFSSPESGPTFECRLDASAWSACTSPKDYSFLSQGGHSIEVAATDAAGNRDASPATRSWNVDSIAPTVTTVIPRPGESVSSTADVLASFSEAIRATTITVTTVRLVRKGTPTPITATVTYDSILNRAKLDPCSSLQRGATYIATVTTGVEDLAGNPVAASKTWSFTVKR